MRNVLTTLEGCPEKVGVNFNCSRNKLTDLKGSPKSIGGWFECRYNEILTLEGIPESIGNNSIVCFANPIYSIFQENVDLSLAKAFNIYRVVKDNVINLKRLKYVMYDFDKSIYITDIEKYYELE